MILGVARSESVCLTLSFACLTKCQVAIRCSKMETDVTANEDRFHRRDILKWSGVTIGTVRAYLRLLEWFMIPALSIHLFQIREKGSSFKSGH